MLPSLPDCLYHHPTFISFFSVLQNSLYSVAHVLTLKYIQNCMIFIFTKSFCDSNFRKQIQSGLVVHPNNSVYSCWKPSLHQAKTNPSSQFCYMRTMGFVGSLQILDPSSSGLFQHFCKCETNYIHFLCLLWISNEVVNSQCFAKFLYLLFNTFG